MAPVGEAGGMLGNLTVQSSVRSACELGAGRPEDVMTKSWLVAGCLMLATSLVGAQTGTQTGAPPAATAASDKADALSAAARKGDAAAVSKLLDEGVDANTKFRYGVTALSFAADHGNLEVVKVLLAHGADPNAKDTFYNATPLTWASSPAQKRKPEHAEIVRLLLKAGANGKEDALQAAVSARDAAMTKAILEVGGLKPEALSTALEDATRAKQTEIVSLLQAAGAKMPPQITLDEAQIAKYVGTYRAGNGGEIVITAAGGKLMLNASKIGGPPQPLGLTPRSETTFAAPDAPGLIVTFKIDDGKITALTVAGMTFTKAGSN
jgi:ankyrin repeat protein